MHLDPIQLRVLGALIEKEITTPENYPLSLNALVSACNQRSSRDPVLDLDEEQVRQALSALQDLGLSAPNRDSRVTKYEHRARTVLHLRRDETALLCLLLLRGAQTPGELRTRADRMFAFEDLAAVASTLERLSTRPGPETGASTETGPLVTLLPRQPGSREARYAHLLGDSALTPVQASLGIQDSPGSTASAASGVHIDEKIARLDRTVEALERRIASLESVAGIQQK